MSCDLSTYCKKRDISKILCCCCRLKKSWDVFCNRILEFCVAKFLFTTFWLPTIRNAHCKTLANIKIHLTSCKQWFLHRSHCLRRFHINIAVLLYLNFSNVLNSIKIIWQNNTITANTTSLRISNYSLAKTRVIDENSDRPSLGWDAHFYYLFPWNVLQQIHLMKNLKSKH